MYGEGDRKLSERIKLTEELLHELFNNVVDSEFHEAWKEFEEKYKLDEDGFIDTVLLLEDENKQLKELIPTLIDHLQQAIVDHESVANEFSNDPEPIVTEFNTTIKKLQEIHSMRTVENV